MEKNNTSTIMLNEGAQAVREHQAFTNVNVFNFRESEVRVVVRDNEPWFVVADVCKVLEVQNPTDAIKKLDDDEKARFNLGLRGGDTNCVNEPGLYSLVLGSRKPEAKAFKRWVTHEVIPSIRKHGGYLTPDKVEEALLNPDTLIKLATNLKAEREARLKAEEAKRLLTEKVEADAPKVLFADAVAGSRQSILIGDFAKLLRQNGLEIGQKRLFERLRNEGYLNTRGDSWNMPSQRSMEMGLFEVKESAIANPDGSIRVTRTPKITGRGQVYFTKRYLCNAAAQD